MFNPLFETLHLDISDLLTSPSLSEKIIYLFIERRKFLSDFNQMFCPAIIDRRADGEVACLPPGRQLRDQHYKPVAILINTVQS